MGSRIKGSLRATAQKIAASEPLSVTVLIVALVGLTYWHYFLGLTSLNGDLNAHYLSDSHDWWSRGGIVAPPSWVPYAWGGRPAGSNLQDGSYVIPQGIAYLLGGWTPQSAAVMSAFVTAFGSVGMYLLVRRLGLHRVPALLALVGQFFAPSIFANAQWMDFHRGAAYLPWLLMVASPLWPWARRWAIPAAALLLWQVAVGIYPGQMIAGVYCVGLWTFLWVASTRRFDWLWRLALAACVGAALAAVKLVPALTGGTGQRVMEPQRINVDWPMLASLFYPYDNPAMGSDIAFRPFFVVVPLLVLAILGLGKPSRTLPSVALLFSGVVLTTAVAIAPEQAAALPGMDLSRVLVNDTRIYAVAGVIIAGAAGCHRLISGQVTLREVILASSCVAALAAALAFSLAWTGWGVRGIAGSILAWILLAGTTFLLVVLARSGQPIGQGAVFAQRLAAAGVVALAVVSGLGYAYSVTSTWAGKRSDIEASHYGAQVSSFSSDQPCTDGAIRRPARTAPLVAPEDYWHDNKALGSAFDCTLALSGYVNIPGHPTLRDQAAALAADGRDGPLHRFLKAPGAVIPAGTDEALLPESALTRTCIIDGECTGLTFVPQNYDPNGEFVYHVTNETSGRVVMNESYYQGWTVTACQEDSCRAITPFGLPESHLLSFDLPAGDWILNVVYEVPGTKVLRPAFFVALAVLPFLALIRPQSRRTEQARTTPARLWESSNSEG